VRSEATNTIRNEVRRRTKTQIHCGSDDGEEEKEKEARSVGEFPQRRSDVSWDVRGEVVQA
jgi:hypothetical protein